MKISNSFEILIYWLFSESQDHVIILEQKHEEYQISWSWYVQKKIIIAEDYFRFILIHRFDELRSEYQHYAIILEQKREQYHMSWKLISQKKLIVVREYIIFTLLYISV